MKKIILLFVMVFAVAGVQAKTNKYSCNVTFPKDASSNCSYNTSTNVFSWTAGNSNSMKIFNSIKGNVDLSEYKYLVVKPTNLSGSYRILIYCDNNGSTTSFVGTYSEAIRLDLTGITLTTSGHTYANINNICIAGSGNSGNLTITEDEVYLESAEYETMEISTPIAELYWYDYSTHASYDRTTKALKKQLNVDVAGDNQILYGPYNGNATTAYMNVTGYDNAVFTLNTAGTPGIRLMYDSSTITIDTDNTNTSYTQSVTTMPKIATIKTKNGSGSVSFNISSIAFTKEFEATSTTAFNIAASSSSTVNYDRIFTAGRKSTVCLPFALNEDEVSDAGTFYELKSVDGTTLTFSPVTTIKAYKPYVFEAKKANPFANLTGKAIAATPATASGYATTVGNYTFQGVLAHQYVPKDAYGYDASDGTFSKATKKDAVTIDAFRGYITYNGGGGPAHSLDVIFDDGETTGIQTIKQAQIQNNVMFNLQGQRVSENHKGMVIVNGKKIMMK